MLSEIFYWILNMSIIGGAVSIIILCLRKIRIIPKSFVYLLWVVPLIRLVLPFGMGNKYSLMALVSRLTTRTVVIYERTELIPELVVTNCVMAAKSYFPIEYKTNLLDDVFRVSSIIWIIIAGAAIITSILLYVFTKSETKGAIHLRDNIYSSNLITAPALYGIIHPKIIIPIGLNGSDQHYVIMHEKTHAARHDNLWRCLAVIICCVHWFNPICWLCLKYFFEDMETSCDNKVLQKLDESQLKEYTYTIINAANHKSLFVTAFGGAKIKVRIENILSFRKLTLVSAMAFAALIMIIISVLITNAA